MIHHAAVSILHFLFYPFKTQFVSNSYEATVKENQPPGTDVLSVSAVDPDEGVNSRLRYDITSGNDAEKFAVDDVSGVITVARNLDADVKSEYRFIVRATDDAAPPERRYALGYWFKEGIIMRKTLVLKNTPPYR